MRKAFENRLLSFATVMVIALLALSGCSGTEKSEIPTSAPTHTIEPDDSTETPSVVLTSTPTGLPATFDAFIDPGSRHAVMPRELESTTCQRSERRAGPIGTVPLPTATPSADAEEISQKDVDQAFAMADLLIQSAIEVVSISDRNWQFLDNDIARANQTYVELKHLENLCGAISVSLSIDQADQLADSMIEALSSRIEMLGSVWNALQGGNPVSDFDDLRSESHERVLTLPRDSDFYSSRNGALSAAVVGDDVQYGNILEAKVTAPSGWIVIRDDSQVLGVALESFQSLDVDALGPESWNIGTGFRLRRFGSNSLLRRSEREFVLSGLMSEIGREITTSESEFSDYSLIRGEYIVDSIGWRLLAAILIQDTSSFLLEMACQNDTDQSCDVQFQKLLDSVELE